MGVASALTLWKTYGKIGLLWCVRRQKYQDFQQHQPTILATISTDSDWLRSNFMNSVGSMCCYIWKHQVPSGLLWAFSLRWESAYKSVCSHCYHGDHWAKWKSWKMPIIRLYVVLKAWVEKTYIYITDLVSLGVELCS